VNLLVDRRQMVRDQAHIRAQAVLEQFRGAIRPLYAPSRRKGMPSHIGTCTLVQVGDVKLIVTAAHIIDDHRDTGLLLGGNCGLIVLDGAFSSTTAPGGDRSQDHFDFSVCKVSGDIEKSLGNATYILSEFFSRGRRQDRKHAMYVCAGYPNSQNKEMSATRREVSVRLWMHTSTGRSANGHLLVDFPKYAENLDGTKRTSTHPRGTSGGPVLYLGDFGDPETYRVDSSFQPMLEGIVVEKPIAGRELKAVKIAVIINALQQAGLLSR
jgi:hypothetical protein